MFTPQTAAVAGRIAGPVGDAVSSLGRLGDSQAQADKLARTNQELRTQLRVGEVGQSRVRELDRLLHIAGAGRYRVVPARVIAIGAAQTFSSGPPGEVWKKLSK